MRTRFTYLHFLFTWLTLGFAMELFFLAYPAIYSQTLSSLALGLSHTAWLLLLPVATLFFSALYFDQLLRWQGEHRMARELNKAVLTRQRRLRATPY